MIAFTLCLAARACQEAHCDANTPSIALGQRNLVIGYAHGLPLETLHYFVNPLQSFTSLNVDTVLFVKHDFRYEPDKLAFLHPKNVFLVPTEQPGGENVYTHRFRVIQQWLLQNRAKYDNVLMTDTRDIYFQGDPFMQISSDGIYVFEEKVRRKIMLEVYQKWIADCYGATYVNRILNPDPQIVSVGVVLGTTNEMIAYLSQMNEQLDYLATVPQCIQATIELYKKPGFGVDTAAHLYLLKDKIPNAWVEDSTLPKSKIHMIPFRRGLVLHACMLPSDEPFEMDSLGRFLNDDGVPYAMIHQYDRYEHTFVAMYKMKYPYFSARKNVTIRKKGFGYVDAK